MFGNKYEASFTMNVTGEVTQENFAGTFKVKTLLSHSDQLRKDQIRRDMLGVSPSDASPRAQTQADIIAEMTVRLLDGPSWFKDNGYGLGLIDDLVLKTVYEKTMEAEKTALEEIKKKAEEAKKELAATQAK